MKNMKKNESTEAFDDHINDQNQSKKVKSEVFQDGTIPDKAQSQSFKSLDTQGLGTFTDKYAHDLNNIFKTILKSSTLLEMNKVNPESTVEFFKSIDNATEQGAKIVGQLLSFCGTANVSFSSTSIPEFIHDTISQFRHTFPSNIKFQEIIDQNIPCLEADHHKLQQMLLNLCIDARDAMPRGGTITIRVNNVIRQNLLHTFPTAHHDQYIHISISETGCGIEETAKDLIFDPFFTTTGRGLRLSVVYSIVKVHHGFIDLESKPGHESTFHLYFPLRTLYKKNDNPLLIKNVKGVSGRETILIVEDEKSLLDLTGYIFQSEGYTVLTAKNGIEAVEMYKQHQEKISLVFIDIGLPGSDGREVFTKLKELNPQVKVIFTSGTFLDVKDTLLKDGAKDFIQKPYTQEVVLRKIREVLDAH